MKLSDIRIRPRILGGFAAPVALMIGVGAVALGGLGSISERTGWVNHTYGVLGEADAILAAAVDMETGMRGYMLAGDEVFLEPYDAASARIGDLMAGLQQTVSDNPPQVERLKDAAAILEEWRTVVTLPMIAMRREIGDADTMNDLAALVAEERGKTFFDRFRAQLAGFVDAERALLVEREATFEGLLNANFVETAATREAIGWVNHTYQAIIDAEGIKEAALNMETGMRGFLLAGRENFLEPFEAGAGAFDSGIVALRQKVSDNPAQVALLGEIADTIADWRAQVVEPMILLRREIGDAPTMDDVADLVGEAQGKAYFDAFRGVMAAFIAEEEELLTLRSDQNAATHQNAAAVIIGGLLVAIALSVGLGWLIGNSVATPVLRITDAMSKLAGGDRTTDIPGAERKDEVGEMAAAVGVFRDSMIRSDELAARDAAETQARQARSAQIETLATEFDATVTHMLGGVTGAATNMEETARAMAGVAQDTSQRAADVAAASGDASTSVQTVASATEELTSSIREIGRRIAQSSAIAGRAVEEARQTDQQVKGLAESATRIGDVVRLISDIAEQTNLLALNATIEAARAGDAGKGFAVVASEVKTLATQTANATEDISRQIDAIQKETQSAVDAIQSIGRVISEIDEISTGVASAVEEQGAATEEIARNVQQAAAGADAVNRNIEGVTSAASETGAAAGQASNLARSLNAKADELKAEIDEFLSGVRAA